ncbi:hypothetical protein ACH4FE_36680 [Streptomyces celluloflavus]|uniref:hypothetical protein n=1 Tax=Streptomyces celluloflavus TaxID=58344 RepID=UPI0037A1F854
MTEPDPSAVALELKRLRRSVEVGFAKADGDLAPLVQRSDQTDASLDGPERIRWPLPGLTILVSLAALDVTLWQAAAAR